MTAGGGRRRAPLGANNARQATGYNLLTFIRAVMPGWDAVSIVSFIDSFEGNLISARPLIQPQLILISALM